MVKDLPNLTKTEYVDSHCHILPGVDHGAKDQATAFAMAQSLCSMGFSSSIATPHYYFYEESADSFVSRRNASVSSTRFPDGFRVISGAEIAYEIGLSKRCDLSKLVIEGTDRVMIELPMKRYSKTTVEELYDIRSRLGLKSILAHIERYIPFMTFNDLYELSLVDDLVFQMNIYSFNRFISRHLMRRLLGSGANIVFGTDIHGTDDRLSHTEKGLKKIKDILHPQDLCHIMSCEDILL